MALLYSTAHSQSNMQACTQEFQEGGHRCTFDTHMQAFIQCILLGVSGTMLGIIVQPLERHLGSSWVHEMKNKSLFYGLLTKFVSNCISLKIWHNIERKNFAHSTLTS